MGFLRLIVAFAVASMTLALLGDAARVEGAGFSARLQTSPAPLVPRGLVEVERGSRTLDEIAAGFPSPSEAAALMVAWGWEANAFYNFSGSTPTGTTWLEGSFHLFGSEA